MLTIDSPRNARGFTLVEMMVAIALGLLVVSAVLAFIFSLIRANSETVLSTRLNQELRATMSLVANDLRRARGLADPISAVNQGGAVVNPFSTDNVGTAGCALYSYAEDIAAGSTNFRAVRLSGGKVVLVRAATAGAATCNAAGTPLNTDAIEITGLTFSNPGGNVSNLRLNPDGTVRDLNGFAVVTSTQDGRERQNRFGVRLGW